MLGNSQPARIAEYVKRANSSANGGEQRTIVLAVERNTKVMEPVVRDPNE